MPLGRLQTVLLPDQFTIDVPWDSPGDSPNIEEGSHEKSDIAGQLSEAMLHQVPGAIACLPRSVSGRDIPALIEYAKQSNTLIALPRPAIEDYRRLQRRNMTLKCVNTWLHNDSVIDWDQASTW
ncbi:MAG: hypothetical protein WBL79_07160, partial [Bacillota bacterium]